MALRAGQIFRISIANDYVAYRTAAAVPGWQWREVAAVPVAVLSMLALILGIAAEPWVSTCRPVTALPLIAAGALLFMAADLLLDRRSAWSRSRNNAAMNSGTIGFMVLLLFSIASSQMLAWPLLYPVLMFPLSLVVPVLLGLGTVSWLPIEERARRMIVSCCLVTGAALLLLDGSPFQASVACRWGGS
jgi:hypothetical protein